MVTLYKPKQKAQHLGQQVKLQVESTDYEVNGIGRWQQKIAFVSGALAGEQVLAKVTEDKAHFIKARVERVLKASPLRVTPFCPHYQLCGGCQLQHVASTEQARLKQQGVDELIRHQTGLGELPWQPLLTGPDQGYRRKARIGVWFDRKRKQLTVGFRESASKTLTPIKACVVLQPQLQPIFAVLQQVVPQLSEPSAITHVEVIAAEQQVFLIVRHIKPLTTAEQQLFVTAWPDAVWQGEAEAGQLTNWQPNAPSPRYRLSEQGLELAFAATDFIQVNPQLNQQMVSLALQWLQPQAEDNILDLYAGMGNFSLALAQRAKLVHGVEGLATMVQQATANAQLNGITNTQFWQADLHLAWGKTDWNNPIYQKIVLDPARAGAEGAMPQLVKLKPAQILYISCNAATFARDAKVLLQSGYQLQKIAGIDMFPHTSHLELMALFSR
ncbi:23S rRNA (uracil(1939)-C(5))-methyltransferase RlmD [Rheinheimera sp. UJ63]|uniref:23S rRNA (uracil(1939)-C(5))-methyltransferase RlmD n=1 Tax=Rheinheimera sp. UJ63 TaxID=2910157 RepID=UPI001F1F7339|nr:23S rRNA (uracil(1939)-C(5))-methyltransferase RlmD [Rheinheimera sp. UJ63]MCF4008209.1 23S rRNA (uracil(1939)-C(5))-methyltransferase RlmD [Rheinheimera sp. UJ63]